MKKIFLGLLLLTVFISRVEAGKYWNMQYNSTFSPTGVDVDMTGGEFKVSDSTYNATGVILSTYALSLQDITIKPITDSLSISGGYIVLDTTMTSSTSKLFLNASDVWIYNKLTLEEAETYFELTGAGGTQIDIYLNNQKEVSIGEGVNTSLHVINRAAFDAQVGIGNSADASYYLKVNAGLPSDLPIVQSDTITIITGHLDMGDMPIDQIDWSGSDDGYGSELDADYWRGITSTEIFVSTPTLASYMLNTGDTASGDYTFDTTTLFIDSVNNKIGILNAIPNLFNSAASALVIGDGLTSCGQTFYTNTSGTGSIFFADGTAIQQELRGHIQYHHSTDDMIFGVEDNTVLTLSGTGANVVGNITLNGTVDTVDIANRDAVLTQVQTDTEALKAFDTVINSSTQTLLQKSGGTMSGNIAMGNNNITGINLLEIDSTSLSALDFTNNGSITGISTISFSNGEAFHNVTDGDIRCNGNLSINGNIDSNGFDDNATSTQFELNDSSAVLNNNIIVDGVMGINTSNPSGTVEIKHKGGTFTDGVIFRQSTSDRAWSFINANTFYIAHSTDGVLENYDVAVAISSDERIGLGGSSVSSKVEILNGGFMPYRRTEAQLKVWGADQTGEIYFDTTNNELVKATGTSAGQFSQIHDKTAKPTGW